MIFKRIKQLRIENSYSQKYLADILNTYQSNYSKWENGVETIPLEKLFILAKFYNLSIDYIVGLSDIKNKNNINKLNKIIIGNNIKKICETLNITQIKLAKFLETTQSTVSAFQNGKVLILTKYIYLFSKKYKFSIEYICNN